MFLSPQLGMCNLQLVTKFTCTAKMDVAFKGADVIFLAGGFLHLPGLSRNDVISSNALESKVRTNHYSRVKNVFLIFSWFERGKQRNY